jgi:hypothetical protein
MRLPNLPENLASGMRRTAPKIALELVAGRYMMMMTDARTWKTSGFRA